MFVYLFVYRQSGAAQYTVTPNVVRTVYPGYDTVTYSVLKLHPKVQFDFFITPRPVTCSAYVTAGNYTGKVYSLTFNVQFADCKYREIYEMISLRYVSLS